MDNEIRNVFYKTTSLPKKPNIALAAQVLMEVQDSIWSERKYINTSLSDERK